VVFTTLSTALFNALFFRRPNLWEYHSES